MKAFCLDSYLRRNDGVLANLSTDCLPACVTCIPFPLHDPLELCTIPFMKTSRFFAVLFFLFLVLPVRAEMPFVIDSAWCVPNNEWLQWSLTTGFVNFSNRKGFSDDFPEEIQADKPMYGAVITDGNKVGVVIALPLKNSKKYSLSLPLSGLDFTFKFKLQTNIVIASMFPDMTYKMFQHNSYLFLVSSGFTKADTLALEDYWVDLYKKFPCSLIKYYPERTLLPTLPLEHENESDFIKFVRANSAWDYQDGQYVGKVESNFWGIEDTDDMTKIVWELVYAEELSTPPDKDKPFPFGGFADSGALASGAFRIPSGKEDFEKITPIFIKYGTTVIPQEERGEEGHKREFGAGFFYFSYSNIEEKKSSLQDDWHIISDENFSICYPKQAEDRPEEDDLPSNAELDKINEKFARMILSYVIGIRQSLVSKDWTQPLDVAVLFENDVLFFACSSPTGNSFAKEQSQSETVTWHQMQFALSEFVPVLFLGHPEEFHIDAVFGYESDKIYAAFSWASDDVTEEQYEILQQQLGKKSVLPSKRLRRKW